MFLPFGAERCSKHEWRSGDICVDVAQFFLYIVSAGPPSNDGSYSHTDYTKEKTIFIATFGSIVLATNSLLTNPSVLNVNSLMYFIQHFPVTMCFDEFVI